MKKWVLVIFIIVCTTTQAAVVGGARTKTVAHGRDNSRVTHVQNPSKSTVNFTTEVKQPIPQTIEDTEPTEAVPIDDVVPEVEPDPEPDYSEEIAMATEYIARLQAEIDKIDAELSRCKKAKRNWTIGTVAGSVGVAGTVTGAIIQANQISKAKKAGAVESANTDTKTESDIEQQ